MKEGELRACRESFPVSVGEAGKCSGLSSELQPLRRTLSNYQLRQIPGDECVPGTYGVHGLDGYCSLVIYLAVDARYRTFTSQLDDRL